MTTETTENYLEAIYNLINEEGEARTNKVAKKLEVKPPSVSEMLNKLDDKNLIKYNKYEEIKLTKKGKEIARNINKTHKALERFFNILQVPENIAEEDACKAEHQLNQETVKQLQKFSQFLKNCPKNQPSWIKHFKTYSKTGKYPDECYKK